MSLFLIADRMLLRSRPLGCALHHTTTFHFGQYRQAGVKAPQMECDKLGDLRSIEP